MANNQFLAIQHVPQRVSLVSKQSLQVLIHISCSRSTMLKPIADDLSVLTPASMNTDLLVQSDEKGCL
jgi:hypothetical protein